MFLSFWRSAVRKRRTAPSCRPARIRLNLEVLESRTTPAVFTVNTFADTVATNFTTGQDANGNVSLRSAIQAADNLGGAETILLSGGSYRLTIGDGPRNSTTPPQAISTSTAT